MTVTTSTTETALTATALRHDVIARREGAWFQEPQREALLKTLDLEANAPARLRERGIAVVSEANNGKSALLRRYLELHPCRQETERQVIPCIIVDMSKLSRVQDLSIQLLTQLKDLDPEAGNHTQRLDRFVALSRKVGLQLTFLDEFHDAADTTGKGKPFLRCIKSLMNDHVRVVPVGVDILAKVFSWDPQLSSRFQFSKGRIDRIDDLGIVKSVMMNISGLGEKEVSSKAVRYVHQQTKGVFGHICDLTENTVVESGGLSLDHLAAQRALMDCLDDLV